MESIRLPKTSLGPPQAPGPSGVPHSSPWGPPLGSPTWGGADGGEGEERRSLQPWGGSRQEGGGQTCQGRQQDKVGNYLLKVMLSNLTLIIII